MTDLAARALRAALEFAESEVENRAYAGTSMSDYQNEAEEVVDLCRGALAALSRAPGALELGSSTRMTSPASRSQTPLSAGEGGIYTASKTTHAGRWKRARATGLPIIATWIDESGVGETARFVGLWDRCIGEAARADCVVLYRETGETLKGALVEAGAALASGKLVLFAGDPDGLGSFLSHRNVERCDDLAHAFQRAQAVCDRLADERSARAGPVSSPPSTGGEGEAVAIKTEGWAALAQNRNIRLWSADFDTVHMFAMFNGCEVVRLVSITPEMKDQAAEPSL